MFSTFQVLLLPLLVGICISNQKDILNFCNRVSPAKNVSFQAFLPDPTKAGDVLMVVSDMVYRVSKANLGKTGFSGITQVDTGGRNWMQYLVETGLISGLSKEEALGVKIEQVQWIGQTMLGGNGVILTILEMMNGSYLYYLNGNGPYRRESKQFRLISPVSQGEPRLCLCHFVFFVLSLTKQMVMMQIDDKQIFDYVVGLQAKSSENSLIPSFTSDQIYLLVNDTDGRVGWASQTEVSKYGDEMQPLFNATGSPPTGFIHDNTVFLFGGQKVVTMTNRDFNAVKVDQESSTISAFRMMDFFVDCKDKAKVVNDIADSSTNEATDLQWSIILVVAVLVPLLLLLMGIVVYLRGRGLFPRISSTFSELRKRKKTTSSSIDSSRKSTNSTLSFKTSETKSAKRKNQTSKSEMGGTQSGDKERTSTLEEAQSNTTNNAAIQPVYSPAACDVKECFKIQSPVSSPHSQPLEPVDTIIDEEEEGGEAATTKKQTTGFSSKWPTIKSNVINAPVKVTFGQRDIQPGGKNI